MLAYRITVALATQSFASLSCLVMRSLPIIKYQMQKQSWHSDLLTEASPPILHTLNPQPQPQPQSQPQPELFSRCSLKQRITPPFTADGPRNIMHLLNAWAEGASQGIYSTPFTVDGPRNIMHLPDTWAKSAFQGIYPPPFTTGQPRTLMHLPSTWVESACQGIYISNPLHSGLAKEYHLPLEHMG